MSYVGMKAKKELAEALRKLRAGGPISAPYTPGGMDTAGFDVVVTKEQYEAVRKALENRYRNWLESWITEPIENILRD